MFAGGGRGRFCVRFSRKVEFLTMYVCNKVINGATWNPGLSFESMLEQDLIGIHRSSQ